MSSRVCTFNAVLTGWTRPHVFKECLVGIDPFSADVNPSAAVILKTGMAGSRASLLHVVPDAILDAAARVPMLASAGMQSPRTFQAHPRPSMQQHMTGHCFRSSTRSTAARIDNITAVVKAVINYLPFAKTLAYFEFSIPSHGLIISRSNIIFGSLS